MLGPALAAWVLLAVGVAVLDVDLDKGAFGVIDVALPFGALTALVGSFRLERVLPERLGRLQVALGPALLAGRRLPVAGAPPLLEPQARGRQRLRELLSRQLAVLRPEPVRALPGARDPHARGSAVARAPAAADRLLLVLASAGVFVGLALSYSQSSLLALDVGLVVIAGVVWRGRAVPASRGSRRSCCCLLAVPTTRHKIFHTSLSNVTSNRSSILSKGIDAFQRHPFAGSGLGSFARSAGTTAQGARAIAPHNVVLQEAVELGVLGLIVLVGIVLALLRLLLRPADAAKERTLRLVLAAELAAIGVSSLFYAALFEDPMFWVAARSSRSRRLARAPGERHRHARERVDQVRGLEDSARSRRAGTRRRPRRAALPSARAHAPGARTAGRQREPA